MPSPSWSRFLDALGRLLGLRPKLVPVPVRKSGTVQRPTPPSPESPLRWQPHEWRPLS